MNRKFVSKSNYVLRKVLNKEENLDILKDMIESILQIKIKKIELNPYLEKKKQNLPAEENFGIADVRLEKADGEELNVGIQFVDGYHVITKMLIYYAQIHANQLEYDKDRKVAKTVTINFVDFEIFCDEKEFGMPENGYKISMSIPSFGTFDFSDKNSKYIKFYKSVGKFLSDNELMQEFENTVIKYVTELFPISDKISIIGNAFNDYKLKQYKKEQSAESLKIAKKLKETFDSMDLSDKYVAIIDLPDEYSYTVTYRNKKYVCLTEIPKTKDEIKNEVLADKNMKRNYRNRYLLIVPAKRVKTRDVE